MAFIVATFNPITSEQKIFRWQDNQKPENGFPILQYITDITATYEELEKVRYTLPAFVPRNCEIVCVWFGDIARLIYQAFVY